MTLFSDRWLLLLSVAIGVQHTEVPNLGVVSDAFFRYVVTVATSCYRGPTNRGAKSGGG